jgi:hypothetical protein
LEAFTDQDNGEHGNAYNQIGSGSGCISGPLHSGFEFGSRKVAKPERGSEAYEKNGDAGFERVLLD